jgi:hypothetical protein
MMTTLDIASLVAVPAVAIVGDAWETWSMVMMDEGL